MKRLITILFLLGIISVSNLLAQEVYWTENWNDDTIEGRLTGSSSSVSSTYADANQTTGTWQAIYAYRGGSNQCDVGGRTLRLMKQDPASRPQGGGAITPSLDSGVGTVTFVEGRGGTNRVIIISKSQDEGLTWEQVTTLNGTEKCVLNVINVNDPLANRVRFENGSTGDCDLDSITVTKFSGVGVEEEFISSQFVLNQNYPNPFNPTTTLSYSIPKTSNVQIKVFDQLGREVETLLNKEMNAGNYSIEWNAASSSGKLASGVYLVQLRADSFMKSIKVILLK